MKKVIAASVLSMMASQIAFAGDIQCMATVETQPGSGHMDKSVFSEIANLKQDSTTRFLLTDGTVVRAEDLTPEKFATLKDGTLAFVYSFPQGQIQLVSAVVKKDKDGNIKYTNVAISNSSAPSNKAFLVANGSFLACGAK